MHLECQARRNSSRPSECFPFSTPQIPFTGQLLDLVGFKPRGSPGRDGRRMDLNLRLCACLRSEVVQREPLFSKAAGLFLWRTSGLPSRLLACLPVSKTPRSIQFVHRGGRQAAIFPRLPYLAFEMVLKRQVAVAMVTSITPAAKLRKGHKG